MVCSLPAPIWTSSPGLISATENVADGYINLTLGDSTPTAPAPFSYYLIYYSLDIDALFDRPKLIATASSVSIPPTLVTLDHYIVARTAQRGIATDLELANLISVGSNLYLFPSQTQLENTLAIGDGYLVVNSAVGYPSVDGYVLVGDEAILYSDVVDGYDGYVGLRIADRDPFGCNTIVAHLDGYAVSLFKGFEDKNTTRLKSVASCGMPRPEWSDIANPGIKLVEDSGIGTTVKVEWVEAKAPRGFSRIYYNVYQDTSLVNMLSGEPLGFSTSTSAIIPDLTPGKGYYYLVRASYQLSNLPTTGFDTLSQDFFAYPAATQVQESDGYFYEGQVGNLFVTSTEGYPASGYLNVGSEILKYISITSNSFNISQRDVFGVGATADYPSGQTVAFFKGIEDDNRFYYRTTPSWDAGVDVPRMPVPMDGPEYMQDSDGYRSIPEDLVTEDHTAEEDANSGFDSFHYCGYRTADFSKLFSRQQCGTYSGGRQDGFGGGIDIFTANAQRAEILLGLTGEMFILLRRKWTGKQCPILSMRTEHPHARCGVCYGTGFTGGYDRYLNQRTIRPNVLNPNGFIAMRVSPYQNDLELSPERGLVQVDQLEVWTLPVPIIKDRDILVRFILDPATNTYLEEYRYEILNVTRNKLLFGKDGIQKATIKKLDKTREVLKIPVTLV